MTRRFHPLTIAHIRPEIGGKATSVTFDVPPALHDLFRWQPGQHLPLRFNIDGQEHRRTYTLSRPMGDVPRITVKRVQGGVVSNHIADALRVGDVVEAGLPTGRFVLTPQATGHRTHYFIAAGSGITPLLTMIRALLEDEPYAVAHLLYGNRRADDILLLSELEELTAAHPDRFSLRHVLSAPSMWHRLTPWRSGRIDAEALSAWFAEAPPVAQDVQYWICGPGTLNRSMRDALTGLDVPAPRIHMESFGGAVEADTSVAGIAATARLTLDGTPQTVQVRAGQTVLEAALAAGLRPDHSCQSGACGSCRARLASGQVHMRAHMALDADEIAQGQILTCQSLPATPKLNIRFED
jgi:ring-1,2-phenylacetyl-CoA epoxidase subunit PaaE